MLAPSWMRGCSRLLFLGSGAAAVSARRRAWPAIRAPPHASPAAPLAHAPRSPFSTTCPRMMFPTRPPVRDPPLARRHGVCRS
jgi:hypothetical protein